MYSTKVSVEICSSHSSFFAALAQSEEVCAGTWSLLLLCSIGYCSCCIRLFKAGFAKDWRLSLSWHFYCCCPILKQRPVLKFSPKTAQGKFFDFFVKSQNELVWPKLVFLTILLQELTVVRKCQVLAITHIT